MSHRPRVLVISQLYAPEPNFITANVAEALATCSDVVVVTAHPNYPFGKFYPGTHFLRIRRSLENGVIVWRLPFFPDHSLSAIRRGISYLSFAVIAALVAPFVAGKPQTVWVYHGPFTTGLAALFFRLVYRSRLVLTAADLWPESFVATSVGRSRLLMRIATTYDRAISRMFATIICPTWGALERFKRYAVPESRLVVIPLWVSARRQFAPDPASDNGAATGREPVIVYTGNLGPTQRVDTIIRAAALLRKRRVPIRFAIYGTGALENELRALAEQCGATNVAFHGLVPPAEAKAASAEALAQIVSLDAAPELGNTVPSKLYAAIGTGSPILFALSGEAAAIAMASGGGIPYAADDPATLVSAIEHLMSLSTEERTAMRGSLRTYFDANLDPSILIPRYVNVLAAAGSGSNAYDLALSTE